MTSTTFQCIPGHKTGSKPYIVPVAGNNDREVPLYLIYHGREYLDGDGAVVLHPERMQITIAQDAIARHEFDLEAAEHPEVSA